MRHTPQQFPHNPQITAGYRLLQPLGSGGLGLAYLAEPATNPGSKVVVKLLRPHDDASLLKASARLRHEAQALQRLHHPNIVALLDSGEIEHEKPFLVLEFAPGDPLSALLAKRQKIPPATTALIASQILAALAHAHAQGVVHRDLKPDNIIVDMTAPTGPAVKVLDFGLAQVTAGEVATTALTGTDMIVGTPRYMAPEQIMKTPIDGRCDLYALGLIMFEMLSTHPFLESSSPTLTLAKRLAEHSPALTINTLTDISPPLRDILTTALQLNPNSRYPSAAAMHNALLAATLSPTDPPAIPSLISPSVPPSVPPSSLPPSLPTRSHFQIVVTVVSGLFGALLLGGLGWRLWPSDAPQTLHATPTTAAASTSPPPLNTLGESFLLAQRLIEDARLVAWELHRAQPHDPWTMQAWFVSARSAAQDPSGGCAIALHWTPTQAWKVAEDPRRCGVKPLGTPRCEPQKVLDIFQITPEQSVAIRYSADAQNQAAWVVETTGKAALGGVIGDVACTAKSVND